MSASEQGPHRHNFLELFDEPSMSEKVHKVVHGLRQPRMSGDYKYAKLQVLRLSAPVSAIVAPCMIVAALVVFVGMNTPPPLAVEVQIIDPEAIEELEEIDDVIEEPPEIPEPMEMDFTADVNVPQDAPVVSTEQPVEFDVPHATFDAVAMIKSPVVMRGIYGSRSPGGRRRAIVEYGGTRASEGAVLRALRWLKKYQKEDGSWPMQPAALGPSPSEKPGSHPMAMTGLGLLTFLAHGETPSSREFGKTVEKAIRYLLAQQTGDGRWQSSYTHAIAAYAICEAYALTKVPMIKSAAERGVDVIIAGQNVSGGWNYPIRPCGRDDTSVMGWCVQALKAGKMAGLENEGLDNAMKLAVRGFQKQADPNGGFTYATTSKDEGPPRATGLSGVGVLCMQFLGASKRPEARKGLMYLDTRLPYAWSDSVRWRNIYYWYYITQAKFHAGGRIWKEWNESFAPQTIENQIVLKGEGEDGKDIGYWISADAKGAVMDTTLTALQLQVYYRYLPTYKTPTAVRDAEEYTEEEDIEIEVTI